jgi:hypothetical protein
MAEVAARLNGHVEVVKLLEGLRRQEEEEERGGRGGGGVLLLPSLLPSLVPSLVPSWRRNHVSNSGVAAAAPAAAPAPGGCDAPIAAGSILDAGDAAADFAVASCAKPLSSFLSIAQVMPKMQKHQYHHHPGEGTLVIDGGFSQEEVESLIRLWHHIPVSTTHDITL